MSIFTLTRLHRAVVLVSMIAAGWFDAPLAGQVREDRSFLIELYIEGRAANETVEKLLTQAVAARRGVRARVVDVSSHPADRERFAKICRYFQQNPAAGPYLYGCNGLVKAAADRATLDQRLDQLLTLEVFVRSGCPHCADAKTFLARTLPAYPGLMVVYRDLVSDAAAPGDLQRLVDRYHKRAVSVPVIHYLGQLQVGFDQAATTGALIEQTLRKWSVPSAARSQSRLQRPRSPVSPRRATWRRPESASFRKAVSIENSVRETHRRATGPVTTTTLRFVGSKSSTVNATLVGEASAPPAIDPTTEPLPLPEPEGLPWPDVEDGAATVDGESTSPAPANSPDSVDLPLFGRISERRLGLPLFTIAVGLVDGFNPCAMWVLLFLLSILVNLRDRGKILAVAGTFVIISGLAYFAFMAAWLSVFELIGLMRPAQIVLGLAAVFIGLVHVKDFLAFKQGLTFSIPESAKPGIYARVRRIVTAEHLTGAIAGAIVLALLVNVIELLCTAGLPAMYTEILSLRKLPKWQDYAYLGLYNLAYVFDDSLMVSIVVITLGKRKLQEHEGRWLKLVSGAVILTLGMVMLWKPEWLV